MRSDPAPTDPAESQGPSTCRWSGVSPDQVIPSLGHQARNDPLLSAHQCAGIVAHGGVINGKVQHLMALSIEQERQQLEAEEQRLADRRKKLLERERTERLKLVEQSGLFKADGAHFESIMTAIKKLGIEEVDKRLTA